MKNLLIFLFIVKVLIPLNPKTYDNVVSFFANQNGYYVLSLSDNKTVYVPIFWTIIEEKK